MYDIIIVGGGPAGMAAAIYAVRANTKVCMIEYSAPGGQMVNTSTIDNYPGFGSINGADLSLKMLDQVMDLGVEYIADEIVGLEKDSNDNFILKGTENNYYGKTVIIATGTKNKNLEVPGEQKYDGRGISYCAVCDGNLYKDKEVVVVGGGNSALEESIYLSSIASKVYLIHRRSEFRGETKYVEKIKKIKNIEFILNTVVTEFKGGETLTTLSLLNTSTNEISELEVSGCFEYVGQEPNTSFLKGLGITNKFGYILVDDNCETTIEKLFAAGDVIDKKIRQITTAVSDGSISALNAVRKVK